MEDIDSEWKICPSRVSSIRLDSVWRVGPYRAGELVSGTHNRAGGSLDNFDSSLFVPADLPKSFSLRSHSLDAIGNDPCLGQHPDNSQLAFLRRSDSDRGDYEAFSRSARSPTFRRPQQLLGAKGANL